MKLGPLLAEMLLTVRTMLVANSGSRLPRPIKALLGSDFGPSLSVSPRFGKKYLDSCLLKLSDHSMTTKLYNFFAFFSPCQ